MHKRTKALAISAEVNRRVYERDGGCCILCGRRGDPWCHYISRSQGGLGIEQNIVTLCQDCHREYDQSTNREELRDEIAEYLRTQYPDWDNAKLTYYKWR